MGLQKLSVTPSSSSFGSGSVQHVLPVVMGWVYHGYSV